MAGDRIRVSKSGINDYAPGAVDMLNGTPVEFKTVPD